MRLVSVPASSSVTPNETWSSPLAVAGSVRCFSSSDPWWMTGAIPKIDKCSAEAAFWAPGLAATALSSAPACRVPSPAPPYASGIRMPIQPCSAKVL
jgi:hypothetical protein